MNNTWRKFLEDPRLKRIIEEAQEDISSDDDPELSGENTDTGESAPEGAPQEQGPDLEGLIQDFQQGNITQDDLIKKYQQGEISKDDVQQIINAAEGGEEPQSQEELLSQQVDQTADLFVKFALFDKINELNEKLEHFQDNFNDTQSGIYDKVIQLKEFLKVLSSLIFSIETNVSYQMYGEILLQLTELFNDYNKEQVERKARMDAQEEKDEEEDKEKLRSNSSFFNKEKNIGLDDQQEY
jgi:hypothetical protein